MEHRNQHHIPIEATATASEHALPTGEPTQPQIDNLTSSDETTLLTDTDLEDFPLSQDPDDEEETDLSQIIYQANLETVQNESKGFVRRRTPTDKPLTPSEELLQSRAIETLYEKYQRPLTMFVLGMLHGDLHTAEDVVQQAMLKIYNGYYLTEGTITRTMIYEITKNTVIDEIRKRNRHLSHAAFDQESEEEVEEVLNRIVDPNFDTQERVEQRESHAELQVMINTLPTNFKRVVELRTYQSLSFPQIAKLLNMPENTAKTYYQRGKKLLQKTFGNKNIDGNNK